MSASTAIALPDLINVTGVTGETKDRSDALKHVSEASTPTALQTALREAGKYYADPDRLSAASAAAREFAKVKDAEHSAALTYALGLITSARKADPKISAAKIGQFVTGETDSARLRKQWSRFDNALKVNHVSALASKAGKRDSAISAREAYKALSHSAAKVSDIMAAVKEGGDLPALKATSGSATAAQSEGTGRKVTPGRVVSHVATLVDLVGAVDPGDYSAEQIAAIRSSMEKIRTMLAKVSTANSDARKTA